MPNVRLTQFPPKAVPVAADIVYIGDSADLFRENQTTITSLFGNNTDLLSINATNLKFDTGVLNTIQDIDITASPNFQSLLLNSNLGITTTALQGPVINLRRNFTPAFPGVVAEQSVYARDAAASSCLMFDSITRIEDINPLNISSSQTLSVAEKGSLNISYMKLDGLNSTINHFKRLENLVGYQSFQEQLILSASQDVDTSIIGRTVVNDPAIPITLTILLGDTLPMGGTFDMLRSGAGTYDLAWPNGVSVNGVNGPSSLALPQQFDRSRLTKTKTNDYNFIEYSGALPTVVNWQDVYDASVLAAQNYWVQTDANPLVIKDQNSNDAFRFESDTSTNNNVFRITNTLGQVELILKNDLNPGIPQVLGWNSVSGWNDSAQQIIYSRIQDELLSAVGGAETVKRSFKIYKGGPGIDILLDYLTFNTSTDTTTIENSDLILNHTSPTASFIDSLNTTGTNSYQVATTLTDATPATESATYETYGLNAGVQRLVTRYTGLTDSYLINRNTTFSNHSVSDISNLTVQLSATFNNSASAGGAFTVKTASQSQAFHIQMSTETAKFDIPLTTHDFTLTQTTNIFPEMTFFANSTGTVGHNDALIDLDCFTDTDDLKSSALLQVQTTNATLATFSQDVIMQAWSFNALTDVLHFVGTERTLNTAPGLRVDGDGVVDPTLRFRNPLDTADDDNLFKVISECKSSTSQVKDHTFINHFVVDALNATFSTESRFNSWFNGIQTIWAEVKGDTQQVQMFTNFSNNQADATYGMSIDIEDYNFAEGRMISKVIPSTITGSCRIDTATADEAVTVGSIIAVSTVTDFRTVNHPIVGTDRAIGIATTAAAGAGNTFEFCYSGDATVQMEDAEAVVRGDLIVPSATVAGRGHVDNNPPGTVQIIGIAWETVGAATPGALVKIRTSMSNTNS